MEDADAIALLKHVYASGVTHFDTAEVYQTEAGDGTIIYNETVVGKAIQEIGMADVTAIEMAHAPTDHQEAAPRSVMALAQIAGKTTRENARNLPQSVRTFSLMVSAATSPTSSISASTSIQKNVKILKYASSLRNEFKA